MAYKEVEISDELLEATEQAWKLTAGADEFASEYLVLFEWLRSHRKYASDTGESVGYALLEEDLKVASAFFEVVSTTGRGGLTKLLKVYITPQLWNISDHQREVVKIYSECIKSVVRISRDNHCRNIKIYGRSDAMLSLLRSIHVALQEELDKKPESGLSVSIEGRWLVFSVS